ncbi:3-deoxy-7-phosphoheptulonate synthase [bacterium]|nr:MAG: 3-deoxy-7-phosphoheptulonate synthase [bacterium]
MHEQTADLRILRKRPLASASVLQEELPLPDDVANLVATTRKRVSEMILGHNRRILAIVGPCSIHDPEAALDYARQLKPIADRLNDKLLVVMRAYFEKPRTTVGWKGFINDPDLDGSYHINKGVRLARQLLLDVNGLGLPTGSEYLDLQIPQFIDDVTSWVAIGARTAESQVHRELASGLSMPVGFKNGTDGNVASAIDGVQAASHSHWFPSVTKDGIGAIFQTSGNPDCHVILRGGSRTGPNYDATHVAAAVSALAKRGMPTRVMIDCSHGNSLKDHNKQRDVASAIAAQLKAGDENIFGIMLESNLVAGRQDYVPGTPPTYGQSITDACIDLKDTEAILEELAAAVQS